MSYLSPYEPDEKNFHILTNTVEFLYIEKEEHRPHKDQERLLLAITTIPDNTWFSQIQDTSAINYSIYNTKTKEVIYKCPGSEIISSSSFS